MRMAHDKILGRTEKITILKFEGGELRSDGERREWSLTSELYWNSPDWRIALIHDAGWDAVMLADQEVRSSYVIGNDRMKLLHDTHIDANAGCSINESLLL